MRNEAITIFYRMWSRDATLGNFPCALITKSKSSEARLGVFERKVLTAIFGPTNYNGEGRIKYNDELCTLYKESDIITYIKINRLRWAGHVIQLEGRNHVRTVFAAVVEGRRQKGRPKLRWEDGATGDAKKLGGKTLEEYRKK
jgi:hypothetical protein